MHHGSHVGKTWNQARLDQVPTFHPPKHLKFDLLGKVVRCCSCLFCGLKWNSRQPDCRQKPDGSKMGAPSSTGPLHELLSLCLVHRYGERNIIQTLYENPVLIPSCVALRRTIKASRAVSQNLDMLVKQGWMKHPAKAFA